MGNEHRKRRKSFHLYLLDSEYEILKQKAERVGMTKTEFVRNIIIFGNASRSEKMDMDDLKKWLYELNRIGNNINQVAYKVNANAMVSENNFKNLQEEYINLLTLFEDIAFGR